MSYERSYKNLQGQIDFLKSQLASQKGQGEESTGIAPLTPLPNEKQKEKAVVETSNIIAPGLYRISPTTVSASTSKTYRAIDKSKKDTPNESRNATTTSKDNNKNSNECALPSTGIESNSRSNNKKPSVSPVSESACKKVEEHPRNLPLSKKKHVSSSCNDKTPVSNACNDSDCLMQKKSLSVNACDDNVSNDVKKNDMPEQKKVPLVTKAKSRYIRGLIAKARKTTSSLLPKDHSKFCAWKPTGRMFAPKNGTVEIVPNASTETISKCTPPVTSNPLEPNVKRFPYTKSSVLCRSLKFVFGSSTRVAPST